MNAIVTNTRSITTNLIGMRVTVEDSWDCVTGGHPGVQNNTHDLDIPALLECGYYVNIEIEGLVEDVDDGYDKVYFEAHSNNFYFSSHDGIPDGVKEECVMSDEYAAKNNLILANSTVKLRYDTVGYRWHSGAYAEIMYATNTGPYKVVVSGTDVICVGETAQMEASGAAGAPYTWSGNGDISVSTNGQVTGLEPGIATVIATDADGCGGEKEMVVLKVDTIEASAPVADNSPQLFEGHKTDFGDPCATNDPGQALIVFHVDARDANFVVRDFDVTLKANVLPASITADQPNESWAKVEGPVSGSLNRTDSFEVKYQNPKMGGLYQFEFDLGLSGCANSGANLLLPLGGPDVTAYYNSEFSRYDQWLITLKARLDSHSVITRWFRLRTHALRTVNDMNYKNDLWQESESPCMAYANGTVTLCGYVLGSDQLGNIMYAYTFARAEFFFTTAWLGGHVAQLWSTSRLDSSDDQAAYTAGYAYGENGGACCDYLSPSGVAVYGVSPVEDMQTETAKRAWPSQEPLSQEQWRVYPVSLPPTNP